MATHITCFFHKHSRIYCTYMCLYLFSVTEFNHDNSVKISESDPNTFFHEVKHMWQWTVFSSKLFSRFLRINQRKNLWCTFEVFCRVKRKLLWWPALNVSIIYPHKACIVHQSIFQSTIWKWFSYDALRFSSFS